MDAKLTMPEVQKMVHDIARSRGWWDNGERNFGELIALCHSELSEALEAKRNGEPWERIEEELADVCIRILDMAEYYKLNIYEAIMHKSQINSKRPYKHGKEF